MHFLGLGVHQIMSLIKISAVSSLAENNRKIAQIQKFSKFKFFITLRLHICRKIAEISVQPYRYMNISRCYHLLFLVGQHSAVSSMLLKSQRYWVLYLAVPHTFVEFDHDIFSTIFFPLQGSCQ